MTFTQWKFRSSHRMLLVKYSADPFYQKTYQLQFSNPKILMFGHSGDQCYESKILARKFWSILKIQRYSYIGETGISRLNQLMSLVLLSNSEIPGKWYFRSMRCTIPCEGAWRIRAFHKCIKLPILALLRTLYAHIFAVSFYIWTISFT